LVVGDDLIRSSVSDVSRGEVKDVSAELGTNVVLLGRVVPVFAVVLLVVVASGEGDSGSESWESSDKEGRRETHGAE